MINFKELVHKESGIVTTYKDWLKYYKEYLKDNNLKIGFSWNLTATSRGIEVLSMPCYSSYKFNEILFSDDFDVVYKNDFTLEELKKAICGIEGTHYHEPNLHVHGLCIKK